MSGLNSHKRVSAFAKRAQNKTKPKPRPVEARQVVAVIAEAEDTQIDIDFDPVTRSNTIRDSEIESGQDSIETNATENAPLLPTIQPLRKAVLPIQLTPFQLRPVAYRIVTKKHGLNMKTSGLETLARFMGRRYGMDWRSSKGERFLDEISRTWKLQDRGLFLDGDQLEIVIREVIDMEDGNSAKATDNGSEMDLDDDHFGNQEFAIRVNSATRHDIDWKNYFKVVDAYSQPYYKFNATRKLFELTQKRSGPASLLSTAQSRVDLFMTRYSIALAGIQRQETFQAPTFLGRLVGTGKRDLTSQSITMIKNMLGREGKAFILFGLLSKGPNGNYWLQDSSGSVELNIDSHAIPAQGSYYGPGSLCICDGVYSSEKFIVTTIGTPTCEPRRDSRAAYGYLDFLGIHSPENIKKNASGPVRIDRGLERKLIEEEKINLTKHRMYILGCDIYLDKLETFNALRKLFSRIQAETQMDSTCPVCIVMTGSFVSTPFQPNRSSSIYKDQMDALASLLQEFPALLSNSEQNVQFIFIPGDNDPWESTFSSGSSETLPIKPLPKIFTNRLRRVAPGAIFSSNPTRIAYMTQEIMLVRDNLGARLRRNQLIFPEVERRKNDAYFNEADANGRGTGANDEDEDLDELMDEMEKEERHRNGDDIDELENILYDTTIDEKTERLMDRKSREQRMQEKDVRDHLIRPPQEHSLVEPEVAEARKIVKTILDQGTISPFPLSTRPVNWEYDFTLSLTPVPTAIIMADPTSPPFKVTYQGCQVINPGLFIRDRQVHWVEYTPSSRTYLAKSLYI